jgi:hypothetical protein
MHHNELFDDNLLKRIPMASIVMAINIAMEHVPSQYVVGHLAFKALNKWMLTGKGEDKLLTLRPTLHDEVERARKLYVEWEEARAKKPPPVNLAEDRKRKKKDKKTIEEGGRQPHYGYMALRALECAVNVALGAQTSELVDLLECLDDVPSVSGAELEKVESLTSILQSLDSIFDSSHWKDIVNAA